MNTSKVMKSASAAMLASTLLLVGCRAKVDLDNIDPSAELQLGMALPVATASATFADFIGDDKLLNQIEIGTGTDKVNGENGVDKGVLFFRNTSYSKRNYHKIDLKNYMQDVTTDFYLKDQVSGGVIPATGSAQALVFPLKLKLKGINNDFSNERLDRMTIDAANFISKISLKNVNIKKEDIQKVEIVLYGSNRNAGKAVADREGYFEVQGNSPLSSDYVFEVKDFQKKGFNTNIPIEIDNFDIILQKTITEDFNSFADANQNVVTELGFDFVFYLNPSTPITFTDNSAISYEFKIDFLEYSALYGFFDPSNLMRDKKTDTIANVFEEWNRFKALKLALAKPRIDLDIISSIAAPLEVYVNSIYVSNDKGESRPTTFNETGTQIDKQYPFYNEMTPSDPLDKTTTNSFFLNEETDRGNLDYLFLIQPEYLHWDYELRIRSGGNRKQHRLTKNTNIETETTVTIPFQFLEGMYVDYRDTTDINWAGISLDSLTVNNKYIDSIGTSNVKLRLKVDNTIPLDVKFHFQFLDDKGKPIDMSGLEITTDGEVLGDSVIIKAAENIEAAGNVARINGEQEPTSTQILMNLSEKQFNKITQATKMIYTAVINTSDKSFQENKWVNVKDVSGLDIQLGVAADVDAFLRLDLNGNKDNK